MMFNNFKKEITHYSFIPGYFGKTKYDIEIIKSFGNDTIYNFSKNGVSITGYEEYTVSECFRYGVYNYIETKVV